MAAINEFELAREAQKAQKRRETPFPCMIVVQARMASTRLPGKVLKEILGKPLLAFLVERLRRVTQSDGIIIATSVNRQDDPIAEFCNRESLHVVRGSEEDVLSRFHAASLAFGLEGCVRVTSDCPLIDPHLVDQALGCFYHHYDSLDFLSNTLRRTYARGMDVEIFRASSLAHAFHEAKEAPEKEHVTLYMVEHPELFRLGNFYQQQDETHLRLTVDTKEDFALISAILERLYPSNPTFTYADVLELIRAHPELVEINRSVSQKALR